MTTKVYRIINTAIINKNLPYIEPCPLCGSEAYVWKYSQDFKKNPVSKVVRCSNTDILGTECVLSTPLSIFYKPRIIESIEVWNAYAKAATQQRIKRRSHNIFMRKRIT